MVCTPIPPHVVGIAPGPCCVEMQEKLLKVRPPTISVGSEETVSAWPRRGSIRLAAPIRIALEKRICVLASERNSARLFAVHESSLGSERECCKAQGS